MPGGGRQLLGRGGGATVELVDGLISDAARMAGERSRSEGWFDMTTFKEPYRVEGKKIMGYELAEAFNWELPEVILYPLGGGTGLVGMWKAFNELAELGWLNTNQRPRLVVVQAAGCALVVKAYQSGAEACEYWEEAHTIASGLRVPKSFADRLILRTLRASNGTAIAVSDEKISAAQQELARMEGVFACPEGAATLAALPELLEQGWIHHPRQGPSPTLENASWIDFGGRFASDGTSYRFILKQRNATRLSGRREYETDVQGSFKLKGYGVHDLVQVILAHKVELKARGRFKGQFVLGLRYQDELG